MVSRGDRHGRTSEPGRVGGKVGMSLSSSVTAKPNAILGSSIRRELATGRKQQSCNGSTLRPPGSCGVRSNRVIQKTQGLGGAGVRRKWLGTSGSPPAGGGGGGLGGGGGGGGGGRG